MNIDRSNDQSTAFTQCVSRRAALGRLAGIGVGAALLANVAGNIAQTQATLRTQREEPNFFSLDGEKTRIIFATTNDAGEPTLTYEGPIGLGETAERPIESRSVSGGDVRIEASELGALVTVYLEGFPDAAVLKLTLLLPNINLAADGSPTPFASLAILTYHLTTIGGPDLIEGALQEYEVVMLEGSAEFVMT